MPANREELDKMPGMADKDKKGKIEVKRV